MEKLLARYEARLHDVENDYADRLTALTEEIIFFSKEIATGVKQLNTICAHFEVKIDLPVITGIFLLGELGEAVHVRFPAEKFMNWPAALAPR